MNATEPFFAYAAEREKIREIRETRDIDLTDDPIFQTYRFTNVFREDDKVTKYIRKNDPHDNFSNDYNFKHQIFYTVMSRWFNRIETLQFINKHEIIDNFFLTGDRNEVLQKIRHWRPTGPWVTGAYIIHTPNGMNWDKLEGVVQDIYEVWVDLDNLSYRWKSEPDVTMEWMVKDLCRYRDLGPFMSYEIACDLRWSMFKNSPPSDIMTWANPGPGARRGLWRLFDNEEFKKSSKAGTRLCVEAMRLILQEWRGGVGVRSDEAEMREVEHTLCEFDKYERVRLGEGRPREKFKG